MKVLVNTANNDFGGHRQTITLNGWRVVNAPRPLPGDLTWIGEFRHGTFYAAGDPATFGQTWSDLDAWEVESVTNLEIAERLAARAKEAEVPLADLVEDWGSMAKLAAVCELPWHERKERG